MRLPCRSRFVTPYTGHSANLMDCCSDGVHAQEMKKRYGAQTDLFSSASRFPGGRLCFHRSHA
jgi:hypothetical protein